MDDDAKLLRVAAWCEQALGFDALPALWCALERNRVVAAFRELNAMLGQQGLADDRWYLKGLAGHIAHGPHGRLPS